MSSEQILPWNLAKQFIGQEKSVLDLIAISGGKETRKEKIKNARVTHAWLGFESGTFWNGQWPLKKKKELKDKEVWTFPGESGFFDFVATYDKFDDIEIEIKDSPKIDSLQRLLLDMLSYT
ncbi:hypothetical protein [Spiroplasma endosymbiont of Villa modesta]|uniref:hypothetical protein n=1 Tax=Spiroplasma endosymbiont of Villa modesta TaxID=3066293 RepID=UPI00313EF815